MMKLEVGKKYHSACDDTDVTVVHVSTDQVCVSHDDGFIEVIPSATLQPIKSELEKEYERVVEGAIDICNIPFDFRRGEVCELFRKVLPRLITAGWLNDPTKPINVQNKLDGV